MSSEHGKPRSGAMMTASRPKKEQREGCPNGTPDHHWKISKDRDANGGYPAECRNCGATRVYPGAADPDYMGAYTNYSATEARVVGWSRWGRDRDTTPLID